MKKTIKYKITAALTAFLMLFSTIPAMDGRNVPEAEAAVSKTETVEMQILGTTDLHGQLNSKDYEQGVDYNNGGLARVSDLIKKIRGELPKENSITLDAGDVLYDYTTEYIFSEDQKALQPIYKAMAKIGYDAITLGNHDFDYGYDYILNQLNEAGLRGITVVSNVTDSKTGTYPFQQNILISRKMKTKSGKVAEVKIGIIGQTIPTLASKTQSYIGILKTEDMVENAKTQAKKLKEMGADIIVALSHTGIGPEVPEPNFKNVAYALTKIPEIDVVVCGHEHNLFPTTDMTSPYYKLSGVNKHTYLINGKNVIMAGDRGEAVGVVNLTLEISGNSVEIADRSSEIRKVTAENTKEDKTISALYGDWEDKLLEFSTDKLGELNDGELIQNFYGLLDDNTAIQLLNDSKINYAARYVHSDGKSYKDYPILAASPYFSYGAESADNFVNIKDSITEADLSEIQPYNNYLYLYTITGKQLREWLEWSASAYETLGKDTKWSAGTMADLMEQSGLKSLVREEWLNEWSSFYVFDGIDYVINPSVEPRYDISGNRIDSTSRIKSLKYQGKEVTDDMVFLLATDKITQPTDANRGVEQQIALNGFNREQVVLSNYIRQLSVGDSILPQVDDNWRVMLPADYEFLIKTPYYAETLVKNIPVDTKFLEERDQYRYYTASLPKEDTDTTGPHIVTVPLVTNPTASPYKVAVHASDASEIVRIRYMQGEYGLDFAGWPVANSLEDNTFTVRGNGIYTVYAEDAGGNKTVYKLVIDNFSDNLLGKPKVDTYTNRKTKISGTAEPGTAIVFEAYTGTYESKVEMNGDFSYALPSQPSGSVVKVYVKDEKKGLVSEPVTVTVKRTGPNLPSISPISNNTGYLAGRTNDDDADIVAVIGGKAYVSKNGGKALYESNTEIYNPEFEIVEIEVEIDPDGYFTMDLPPQLAGQSVTVYNIDHLSRNSRPVYAKIIDAAPNAPVVYEISNIERSLSGYVPDPKASYDITLVVGSKTYRTRSDQDGNFTFKFSDQLGAGEMLTVTASDRKNGTIRYSEAVKVKVNDIEKYLAPDTENLTLNSIDYQSYFITGSSLDSDTVFLAIADGEGESFKNSLVTLQTDEFSLYWYNLNHTLEAGTKIYVMTRFTDGKILDVNKTVVLPALPKTPVLLKKVTNTDKLVQVTADKDCEVTLTIGEKTYKTKEYRYDDTKKKYIYSLKTDRDISGTSITISAANLSGTSKVYKSKIVKAAPDSPRVNKIKAGDKVITGKIEVLDSETKVYAHIGTKIYQGTVDKKGNFKITVAKLKTGTEIKVWGTNKAGRGPLIKVKV